MNDLTEKLLVLAYDSASSQNWNSADLDAIYNATPYTAKATIRDNAIMRAALRFIHSITVNNHLLMNYENGRYCLNDLAAITIILLPKNTPRLNEAIKSQFPPGISAVFGEISSDCKPMIKLIKYSCPIALPLIKDIKSCAQIYYNFLAAPNATEVHLDMKTQNWCKFLPEIYGVDAENYNVTTCERPALAISHPIGPDGKMINNDKELYQKIKEAYEYGIKCGYIYRCNMGFVNAQYKIVVVKNLEDVKPLIIRIKNETTIENLSFRELLQMSGNIELVETTIETFTNSPLMERIDECTDDGVKNIYRIIRSRMDLVKIIINAKESYEKSGIFDI